MNVYMIQGGTKKTGYYLVPGFVFNYKKNAVKVRNKYFPGLKVVKFVAIEGK